MSECVRANFALCVERYGEGNCGVWSTVTLFSVDEFGIDLPWCGGWQPTTGLLINSAGNKASPRRELRLEIEELKV